MGILGNSAEDAAVANAAPVQPLASHTPPEEVVDTGVTKHYALDERNASMHRKDGSRLAFLNGVLATSMKADIVYLEGELASGHPVLRRATPDEVRVYEMKRDPKGTIAREITPEIEARIRAELEQKIRAELGLEIGSTDAANADGEKLAGSGKGAESNSAVVDALQRLRAGAATVTMTSAKPLLQGITSTADIAGAAAGSSGQSGAGATNVGTAGTK